MAMTVTLAQLRTRVRQRCDAAPDDSGDGVFLTNAKLDPMINASIAQLQRFIIDVNETWLVKDTPETISVVSGTGTYDLPADFYLDYGVDVYDGSGDWVNVQRYTWGERNLLQDVGADRIWTRYKVQGSKLRLMPDPSWTGTMRLWYIPTPTELVDAADTFDGIAGMEEFVILNCCIQFAAMEESDPATFAAQLAEVKQGIRTAVAERGRAEPSRVRDVYTERHAGYWPDYWRP